MNDTNKSLLFMHIFSFVIVLFIGITIANEIGKTLVRAFVGGIFACGFFTAMCIAGDCGMKAFYIFYSIFLSIVFTIRLICN